MQLLKRNQKTKELLQIILLSLAIALIGILPVLLKYHGNLYLVGDYMTQIIPFIKESRRMILSGTPWWSHTSFLGANFIGTYAYYTLGSPFFWPLVCLPERYLGIGLTAAFILKQTVSSLCAFLYLRTHIRTEGFAMAGALAYAFSAFSLDSTYYFIFLDTIAFFPLVLLFTDRVLKGEGGIGLSFAALIQAAVNYYLFVSTSVFFLLYLFFRIRKTGNTFALRDALRCILYYALGAMAAMMLLLPALCTLLETGKATDSFSKMLIGAATSIPQAIRILRAIVLPNEGVLRSATGFTFFTFNSNAAFLPFFGALFSLAAVRSGEKTWDIRLLRLLFVLSLVPFGNGLFSLFSTMNYTRWWYAFELIAVLVSLRMLERCAENPAAWRRPLQKSAKTIAVISAAAVLPFFAAKILCSRLLRGVLERHLPDAAIRSLQTSGLLERWNAADTGYLIVLAALTVLSYAPLYAALKKGWIYKKRALVSVMAVICALSYCLYLGNECSVLTDQNVSRAEKVSMVCDAHTRYASRTEFKDAYSNYGMLANTPSMNGFNSFKSDATMAFCALAGFDPGSVTKQYFSTPAIQAVLSVQYVQEKNGSRQDAEYYVPFGFVYDRYIPYTGFAPTKDTAENNRRIERMCAACYLDAQTAQALHGVVTPLGSGPVAWKESAAARRESACTDCVLTSAGFRSSSDGQRDRLVYFSIPHDRGWTARIDGEEIVIYAVNAGMMGIVVPAGRHQIEFEFETPGLRCGMRISLAALTVIMALGVRQNLRRRQRKKARP